MKKEGLTFGRSPSVAARHMGETTAYYFGGVSTLTYREQQFRPANEDALRGIYNG